MSAATHAVSYPPLGPDPSPKSLQAYICKKSENTFGGQAAYGLVSKGLVFTYVSWTSWSPFGPWNPVNTASAALDSLIWLWLELVCTNVKIVARKRVFDVYVTME